MNIYKRYGQILLSIFLISFANGSYAEQCGAVGANITSIKGENYVFELIRDNGIVLSQKENYEASNGNFTYQLAPGWHTLSLFMWAKKDYLMIKKTRRRMKLSDLTQSSMIRLRNNKNWNKHTQFITPKLKELKLKIKDGYKTIIGVDNTNENDILKVLSTDAYACNKIGASLVYGEIDNQIQDKMNITLPKGIEYRLRKVMTDISKYHKNHNLKGFNVIPVHMERSFGIVLDSEYDKQPISIKILAVNPNSMAQLVGLYSGDRIIEMGKNQITIDKNSPQIQLTEYIRRIPFNEKLYFKVIRNKEEVVLSHEFTPILSPEINYSFGNMNKKIDIVNNLDIENELEFNLLFITKEIVDFYQAKGLTDKTINIYRSPTNDYIYGISAKESQTKNGFSLYIESVVTGSEAEMFGLKDGDEIVALNGMKMTANGIALISKFISELKYNDSYSMLINRLDKSIEIEHKYLPKTLIGFNLSIDQYVRKKLNDQLTTNSNIRKYEIFEDSVLYKQRFLSNEAKHLFENNIRIGTTRFVRKTSSQDVLSNQQPSTQQKAMSMQKHK